MEVESSLVDVSSRGYKLRVTCTLDPVLRPWATEMAKDMMWMDIACEMKEWKFGQGQRQGH